MIQNKLLFLLIFLFLSSCQQDKYSASEQLETDDLIILDFLRNNMLEGENIITSKTLQDSINYIKLSKGLYYVILNDGSGNIPSNDDIVNINYDGYKIEDKSTFDSNINYRIGLEKGIVSGVKSLITRLKTKTDSTSGGKGYIFMSSTKAFKNFENDRTNITLPKNTCIYYKVELLEILR